MTDESPSLGQQAAELMWHTRHTWRQVYASFPDCKPTKIRSAARRWKKAHLDEFDTLPLPECTSVGVTPGDYLPDEDEVYERACTEYARGERLARLKRNQRLSFSHGPIALVFMADQHFGAPGVDYPRAFAEAEIVAETPGMYCGTVGDMVDNAIIGRILREQMNHRLNIVDQWALLRRYLRILLPKMKISVGGNHDYWSNALSGVDYFRDVVGHIAPGALYDGDDSAFVLQVGQSEWSVRMRHKWRGSSIYNPTHGIERAAKWDQDFEIGVGAHNHTDGVVRFFSIGNLEGVAVQCGTYKVIDGYAKRGGFPKSGRSAAVGLLFTETPRAVTGFTNLEVLRDVLDRVY